MPEGEAIWCITMCLDMPHNLVLVNVNIKSLERFMKTIWLAGWLAGVVGVRSFIAAVVSLVGRTTSRTSSPAQNTAQKFAGLAAERL